jgi:hypothetical protein
VVDEEDEEEYDVEKCGIMMMGHNRLVIGIDERELSREHRVCYLAIHSVPCHAICPFQRKALTESRFTSRWNQ